MSLQYLVAHIMLHLSARSLPTFIVLFAEWHMFARLRIMIRLLLLHNIYLINNRVKISGTSGTSEIYYCTSFGQLHTVVLINIARDLSEQPGLDDSARLIGHESVPE